MGLLLKLLALPVEGPIRGVVWLAERVIDQVEQELYDEQSIRSQISELEMRHDLGEIGEEEYVLTEQDLFDRLEKAA